MNNNNNNHDNEIYWLFKLFCDTFARYYYFNKFMALISKCTLVESRIIMDLVYN